MISLNPRWAESPPLHRVLLIGVLAVVTHFGWFAFDRDHIEYDSALYLRTAESLLEGRGFTDRGVPETLRTPGYPLFVAALKAIGFNLRGIALVQHLFAVAIVVFLARSGWTVAAVVLAIDLPTIVHANKILTETLFTLLLLIVFVLAWRGERPIVAGLVLGAAALVRPIAVLFFVPLSLYFFWTRRRALIAPFAVCALLLPTVWVIRNYRATGVATLSSVSGHHMLFLKAAGVLAIEDPGDFTANLHRRQSEMQALANRRTSPLLPHARRAQEQLRIGREIVQRHPLASVKLAARGVAATMLGGGAHALVELTGISRRAAERLLVAYSGLLLLLAIIGAVRLWNADRRLAALIILTIAYFVGLSAGAESYSRFRVPVMPMYAMAISAALTRARAATPVFAPRPCARS